MAIKNYETVALATFTFLAICATTTAVFTVPSGKPDGAWKYWGEFNSAASLIFTETVTVPANVPKEVLYCKKIPYANAAFWITSVKLTRQSGDGDVDCPEGPGFNYAKLTYNRKGVGDLKFTILVFGKAIRK